jgi:lysophospholipase L1-like esterase
MRQTRFTAILLFAILFCVAAAKGQQATQTTPQFRLQDGDTVVFYGDSITEQKLYTSDIEAYVLTRFPGRNIRFVHSGVGGDKVSGGWAGPIDLRLSRDVFAYHPTMITIMLGMNDGYYRPADPGIVSTYEDGYRHIVDRIQAESPHSTLTLLKPSPYDDVTRDPLWAGGYNATMLQFGEFDEKLSEEKHALVADLNQPVVAALTAAKSADAPLSATLVRDRVHPGTGIHWLMAEAVLRAWGAPAIVTAVKLDAAHAKVVESDDTEVSELRQSKIGLTWTQHDEALPLPFPPAELDPSLALVLRVSDLQRSLDQQTLSVDGLLDGSYELRIDDYVAGTYSAAQLGTGIDLALLDTPMRIQSRLVAMDTAQKNDIEGTRFQLAYDMHDPKTADTVKELDLAIASAIERQRKDVQPLPHRYTLTRTVQGASR